MSATPLPFMSTEIHMEPIANLLPYARNAKIHTEEQIRKLAKFMTRYGFTDPIGTWWDSELKQRRTVAGHGRILALELLAHDTAPTIRLDHLTWEEARAFMLAHNRIGESPWDEELVLLEMEELEEEGFDLEFTGFSLEELLGDGPDDSVLTEKPEPTEGQDAVPEEPSTAITQPGDVWLLGESRIMCGNPQSLDHATALLSSEAIDVCFFYPPHPSAQQLSRPAGVDQFAETVVRTVRAVPMHQEGQVLIRLSPVYFKSELLDTTSKIIAWMIGDDWRLVGTYVWDRSEPPFGTFHGRCCPVHDTILHFNRISRGPEKWIPSSVEGAPGLLPHSVWRIPQPDAYSKAVPVELPLFAIKSWPGLVYAPFEGRGSTLIAAEQAQLRCFAMEPDPKQVDVAVRRWQDYTGATARHEATETPFDEFGR